MVARAKPLVIETEAKYNRADAEIGRLLRKGANHLSAEEERLLMLLSRLIEYENQTFPALTSAPHETLQFLMAQNDSRQAD
jgi:antitoxin component HigA of HigAB toxin-antitoxin module